MSVARVPLSCWILLLSATIPLAADEVPARSTTGSERTPISPVCHCKKKLPYPTSAWYPMLPETGPALSLPPPCPEPRPPGVLEAPPPMLPPPAPSDDLELPTPSVSIRVEVPAHSAIGQELEYRIVAANRSPAAAHSVQVRCRLPENVRYVRSEPAAMVLGRELTWELGTMTPSQQQEIRLVLVPTSGDDVDLAVRVQFEHGIRTRTRLARPALQLRKQGPAEGLVQEPLSFRLTVKNSGTTPVNNVVVTDELPEGLETRDSRKILTFPLGTLGAGETREVAYEVIARRPGRFINRALVTADGGLREEVQSLVTISEPALRLRINAPAEQSFSRSLALELVVSNEGTTPLTNVVVVNPIPSQTTFVSAGDGGKLVGSQVEWRLGTLEAGANRTLELKLRPTVAGRVVNVAEARADRGLRATAEVATLIVGEAGLLLEVVDIEDPVEVGGDTQYNIIIRNQGSRPATNIRITAIVPAEMAVSRVQGPTDHKRAENTIVFDPLDLPPMRDTIYRVFVRALKPGDVRFRVEMTADQLPAGPLREEESTTIYGPARQ